MNQIDGGLLRLRHVQAGTRPRPCSTCTRSTRQQAACRRAAAGTCRCTASRHSPGGLAPLLIALSQSRNLHVGVHALPAHQVSKQEG